MGDYCCAIVGMARVRQVSELLSGNDNVGKSWSAEEVTRAIYSIDGKLTIPERLVRHNNNNNNNTDTTAPYRPAVLYSTQRIDLLCSAGQSCFRLLPYAYAIMPLWHCEP